MLNASVGGLLPSTSPLGRRADCMLMDVAFPLVPCVLLGCMLVGSYRHLDLDASFLPSFASQGFASLRLGLLSGGLRESKTYLGQVAGGPSLHTNASIHHLAYYNAAALLQFLRGSNSRCLSIAGASGGLGRAADRDVSAHFHIFHTHAIHPPSDYRQWTMSGCVCTPDASKRDLPPRELCLQGNPDDGICRSAYPVLYSPGGNM
ncbi:hypothetical protein B0I35DRAFT_423136 [Stachybotrys elegans]|uniref:Uncharacterized protein n=1 Tax=Stachybotrys elegans TaxID=80388 RepID=A0A8K0WVE2_9HYPO|nr:hypothetical protein B0I35DRAFT_423136 [Stachybotrys elegans]